MQTLEVSWKDGKAIAVDDAGKVAARIFCEEPITAKTDSWEIAYRITDETGDTIANVDHDHDTIYISVG